MFKRTLSAIAIGTVLVAGSMTSANAIEITAGNYKIIFDNFDVGTVGYGDSAGVKCNSIISCNNVAGIFQAAGTSSDTAGILSVASITNLSSSVDEYIRGTSSTLGGVSVGPYLTGVFSGLQDYFVEVTVGVAGATTTALAVGGSFSIFSNNANYNSSLGPTGAGVTLDALQYAGISDGGLGSLFLSGVFAPGVNPLNPTATYLTEYKNLGNAGNGSGFLDFTGGLAYTIFNQNGTANTIGGLNDAFLTVTYDNIGNAATDLGWDVKSSGQIAGNPVNNVPEPGSLALISLAMLSLGAVTARRRNKKS